MAEMKQKGMKGFGRMGSDFESKPRPGEHADGHEEGTKTHTIEAHPDGHFESHMHDGTHMEHPNHLHLMAHMGHHLTGGDKHHVVHHDGMTATSHSIHEDGQHDGPHEHNSAEEAKGALDKFLGEEAQEPEHVHGEEQEEHEPAYGGM